MNSGTITNQLLDAVQVLVDDAVKNATFDRTVQAIIVKCVSAAQGKYTVKYQGGYFYAYAQDPDITYTPDMQVYVLIPGNDMNKTKTILGTVDKLGENFVSVEEASVFKYIGNNICSDDEEALYGLHSYLVTDNIVLYEYGEPSSYSFNINIDATNLYLKNSDYLIIAAKFRTNLPPENRVKGNYGLKYTLTFDDPLTGTEVDRSYILDINNMLGMPYNQPVAMRQSAKFRIDKENFKKIKKIELFSEGFVTVEDSSKPVDIFVSDIETMGAVLLPADTSSGYVLNLVTKQGIYFDENDSDSATRLIEAEIYKNRKIQQVSTEDVAYYWFKANNTIYMGDERYSPYGGNQWELINEYTIEEGTGRRIYKTNKSSIQISKQSIPTSESNYKCVVVYRNGSLTLQEEITLYNKSSNYTVNLTCSEPALTAAATATLTCTVSGVAEGHTLNYYWSQKLDDDTYFSELGTTNTNTYNVNLKQPLQMVTYKCFVKDITDNKDIGLATIFITRGEAESFNSYYITIDNDMQVFKYDTDGNSPASQTLLNPQPILPLSFTLYSPEGEEISASEIGASNINWIYSTENTMLTNVQTTGVYGEQLNFGIKNKYDPIAINNVIKLEIKYDDKTIRAKANLVFLKEGENGSNGTAYYLKVEPNLSPGMTLKGKVYYYYKDNSHKGFNFNYPNGQFPFKTLFYRDGNLIYDSTRDNNEITPTVTYDFVKRTYTKINNNLIQDNCNFIISENDIFCVNNPIIGTNAGNYDADILRCTFQYNGLTWYYMYPIIFIKYNENNSANYEIIIPQESGFDEVVFTEDGRNPIYRGNNNFKIEVVKSGEKISTSEDWTVQGQIYTSHWEEISNLLIRIENSEKKFYAKESYDGNSVTNAYYCVLSEGVDEIAKIHFPIAMYLNTYGNAYINEWNGNAIELNEEGGIILTPQIAAGQKENDNTFTGVVAGRAKESTSSTFDEGIFGYNHGKRTFELNAEDGSARFGKTGAGQIVISPDEIKQHSVLQSGNYVAPVIDASGNITQAGEGLQIDLTEPSITFGSGKFRVDSDGSVHATEYALTANLINGDYDIPSAAIQVDNNTSLADYVSTTDSALGDLQDQINGNISTWFYAYEPTLSNEPASTWTTTTEKDNHLGDLFYDTTTGYCYRFMKTGSTYSWGQLSDSDIAEALAAAQAAQNTADNKRRVFVTTPTPPYDIGDLWVEGSTGDIKKCKTAKTSSQSYDVNDWEKASKYTDDTTINTLKPDLVTSTIVEYALGSSSSTAPTSGWNQVAPEWESGKYMWQRTTTIYADDTQQNPHRVTSDPTCLTGATGATGAAGTNTAMVYLYGRFATAPSSKPYSAAVIYTFSTGTLSSIPSGWSQTIPSGTNPLYVSTAIASSNTSTASIAANTWTTPTKFAQDGSNGTNGISVVSIIPLYYLTISATTPTAPSTNHDNESTYPNPDIDVWTKFMPNYRTQDFYDLEKYTSTTEFPETGEEGTIYQAGSNNYYIWNTEVTPNAYTSINTFYCYDKTTTKYYYKATGANLIEINQRYRYFTCEEVKYSNGNHTWTSVIENKELNSLFNQTEAMQNSIDVTNTILNTAQNDIDELQRKNETQNTLNESFRSDIDNNFNMTITEKYLIYQSVKYKYDPIDPTDKEHNKYDKNTSYYIETSPNIFSKINAVNLEDYWIPSAGDGSERKIKDGITLYLKSVPKSPKKPGEWDEDLKRYIQENDWKPSDNKPQWKDGIAIYACEVTKYGNKTKKYDKPYLLTDYQTIEDARSQEAAEVYAAMRGSNNIFYNTNGFFVYDKKTEDESSKRIVINQNGINFATRLRFKEASNPDITNYPDLYYVKEKGLNIYYTIENIGKNYNDTSKYENRNNNVIIYEKDETASGTIGWDTTSAWGIQGNLNLNKIQVINLTADEIGDGVLTLGSTKTDGKLIVQNDNNQENFRISTQRFACPIFNNSKNPEGYLYIGQDIGIQVVGIDGKSRFGNQLTWTTVPSGGVYQNNVNYYNTQGDITSTSLVGNEHEGETITSTVYTCSCKDIFDVMNQRVVGDITFANNNTNIIKTITLNFTTNGITHQGLGFIKG